MNRFTGRLIVITLTMTSTHLYGGTIYTPQAFSSRLGTIDTTNIIGTDIGPFEIPDGGFAPNAAFDTDGTLYAVVSWLADSRENAHSHLATIDVNTGTIAEVGSHMNVNIVALEIDAQGTIFGAGFDRPVVVPDLGIGLFGDRMLYQIDKTTGQPNPVGDTGIDNLMDMAFRSDGTLFATVANNLYTIDPATGASTLQTPIIGVVEATGVEGSEIMGIMFDENDTLFATSFFGGMPDYVSPLFTIDTSTGAATAVGNPGFVNPHGGDIMIPLRGDFDGNGVLDATDIDLLTSNVGTTDGTYDLDENGVVEQNDRQIWVEELHGTYFGDSNLDGEFGTSDLILVFQAGQYEDDLVTNSTWATGDWNGDAEFSSVDLVFAFQAGGYEQGSRAEVNAVPEPSCIILPAIGFVGLYRLGRIN